MVYYILALLILPILVLSAYDEESSQEYWFYNTAAHCDPTQISQWKVGQISDIYPKVMDIHLYENKKYDNFAYSAYNPKTNELINPDI